MNLVLFAALHHNLPAARKLQTLAISDDFTLSRCWYDRKHSISRCAPRSSPGIGDMWIVPSVPSGKPLRPDPLYGAERWMEPDLAGSAA